MSNRDIFKQMNVLNDEKIKNNDQAIIDLTLGQPHLPINPIAITALSELLSSKNVTRQFAYSDVAGREKTKQAICRLMQYYFPAINIEVNNVMCSNGANQALWNAFNVCLGEGDSAVLFCPYFGQYKTQLSAIGVQAEIIYPKDNTMRPNLELLAAKLKNNKTIKCIVLNNPVNPSGVVWSDFELQQLAEILVAYPDVVVIQDEVYRDLVSQDFSSLLDHAPHLFQRVITVFSGSKGLIGAPDIRIGMTLASSHFIHELSKKQMLVSAEVNYLSQVILTAVIHAKLNHHIEHEKWENNSRLSYFSNMDYLDKELKGTPFMINACSKAGLFVLIDFSIFLGKSVPFVLFKKTKLALEKINHDYDIVQLFMHCYGVAFLPASFFGLKSTQGMVRISCATELDNIKKLIFQMGRAVCDFQINSKYGESIDA